MKQGQLSRADLLIALTHDNKQAQSTVAQALGLASPPPASSQPIQPSGPIWVESAPVVIDDSPLQHSPTAQLTASYLQLVLYQQLNDQEDQPLRKKADKSVACQPVIWQNRPATAPVYPALINLRELRSRLFPCLALDCQVGQAVDLPAVIEKISRAEFPGKLPRKAKQHSLCSLQIIDDRQVDLTPYWLDHALLTLRLYDEFGAAQISRAVIVNGEVEPQQINGLSELAPFRLPPAGTPVLLLSDLGRLAGARRQQQYWLLLLRLLRNNNPLTVLTPWQPDAYPVRWQRQVRLLSWEEQDHPRGTDSREGLEQEAEWTELLLTLAAPAVRLEPQLLRCLRVGMRQFDQQIPVAVEARCWRHPDIKEPHNVAASLHPQARKERLKKFVALPPAEQRFALGLLKQWRQPLPPEIWFEELLSVEAQLKNVVFSAKEAEEMAEDIRAGCAFLRQLLEQGKFSTQQGGACQAWAIRVDSRLPDVAVNRGAAGRTWQLISQQLNPGQPLSRSGHALDPDLLPPVRQPEQRAWLCQYGSGLAVAGYEPTQVPRQNSTLLAVITYQRLEMKLILTDESDCLLRLPAKLSKTLLPLAAEQEIPLAAIRTIKTDLSELTLNTLERPPWARSIGRDAYGLYVDLPIAHLAGQELTQRFRWIAGGEFMMGSPPKERNRHNDEEYHQVRLTRGYWLAETTVTQAVWQAVMQDNPAYFKGETHPVEQVSWDDAQKFIAQLTQQIQKQGGAGGLVLRLPTEAEWEHACRAGTVTPFSFGAKISPEQVNYDGNFPYADGEKGLYRKKTVPVKSLPPNPWGLYEMHGNVWEWCADNWQDSLGTQPVTDPCCTSGSDRVVRGGSWVSNGGSVRSAYRGHYSPDDRYQRGGFRLVLGHELQATR
ncbi:hypothetical protein KKHLCK_01705 [Candidatus Electrothrix laxa]